MQDGVRVINTPPPPLAATTLTSLHFIFTALVGTVSSYLTPPENKPNVVPLKDLIIFSIVANGSLVGMNLSLMLNTVGFYQVRTPG